MTASILLFKNGLSRRQQEPRWPRPRTWQNAAVLTSGGSGEQGASGGGGIIHGELWGVIDDHMPRRDGLAVGGLSRNRGRRHYCSLFGGGNRG